MNFGEKIRHLRKRQKMTLKSLGESLKVSSGYISHIEQGALYSMPSEQRIKELADLLEGEFLELMLLADKLPEELISLIKKTLIEGRITYEEILGYLEKKNGGEKNKLK